MKILFDEYDALEDFGLRYSSHTIGSPEPVRMTVEVPSRNGALDLTYSLSDDISYKDREITLNFFLVDLERDWFSIYSNIYNKLHGKKVNLTFCDDKEWYWDCFCDITESLSKKMVGTMTITCTAFPYKMKHEETVVSKTGSGKVILKNNRMKVIPTITSTGNATLTFKDKSIAITSGTSISPDIVLEYGNNEITVAGDATVTFTYREGSL